MEYKVGSEIINGRRYTVTMGDDDKQYKEKFNKEIDAISMSIATIGQRLSWDVNVRRIYTISIKRMSQNIKNKVALGKITDRDALLIANTKRNQIMYWMRIISHSIGHSIAIAKKDKGKTTKQLLSHYAIIHSVEKNTKLPSHLSPKEKKAIIRDKAEKIKAKLSLAQQNRMYLDLSFKEKEAIQLKITEAAGRAQPNIITDLKNPNINKFFGSLDVAGKYMFYISASISIYNIIVSDNKIATAKHEAMLQGVGLAGGYAGGAVGAVIGGPVGAYVGAMLVSALAVYLTESWL